MNRFSQTLCIAALLLTGATLSSCETVGFISDVVAGGDGPALEVTAEYYGLKDQTVAVLINADYPVLYQHRDIQWELGTAISNLIADGVPGVKVIDARDVVAFQNRNIYWSTAPYGELAKKLGCTRLILVELQEFRLHEPGNTMMYRGVASARVEVAEANGAKPNDAAYATVVTAAYPPNNPQGIPDADPQTIRKGIVDIFSRSVAWKFFDHEEKR
jgi:predicted small secreted protein